MNQVYKIIEVLTKEECRNFKVLQKRTNNNELRRDAALFDFVRKNSSISFNEDKFLKEYYPTNKNAFYRLKNRLLQDINKSLLFFHSNSNEYLIVVNDVLLSKIYTQKSSLELAFDFLVEAEKRAKKNEFFELLDIVYNDLINLSIETVRFNPESYIKKRKENREIVTTIQQIDDILAVLTYKIKTTQNYDKQVANKLLEENFYELIENKKINQSKRLQFKVYQSVSRILLAQHDYKTLETYLKKTFNHFINNNLFSKSTHEIKLQMLIYLINALFKNDKISDSLAFAEELHKAMQEYNNFLYNKYLFYYYNSLVINYQVTDKKKAIAILEEAKATKEIQQLPTYSLFIYLNLTVLHFDLKEFSKAKTNVVKLKQQDDFKHLDVVLKLKISIVELIIVFELNDIDLFDYLLKNVKKDFFLKNKVDVQRDIDFVLLLEKMEHLEKKKLKEAILDFAAKYVDMQQDDIDIINYLNWLNSKTKSGTS